MDQFNAKMPALRALKCHPYYSAHSWKVGSGGGGDVGLPLPSFLLLPWGSESFNFWNRAEEDGAGRPTDGRTERARKAAADVLGEDRLNHFFSLRVKFSVCRNSRVAQESWMEGRRANPPPPAAAATE